MGRNVEPIEKKRGRCTVRPVREHGRGNLPALAADVKLVAPKYMPKPARKLFKHLTDVLGAWGILQAVDAGLIEAYVMANYNFQEDQRRMLEDGAYVTKYNPQGQPVGMTEAPWSKSAKENARLIKDLGSKLGFSPVDRARILAMMAPNEEKKDDFAEFVEV